MIAAFQDTARDFLVLRFVLWGWLKDKMSFRIFAGEIEIVVSSSGNLIELWWFVDEDGLIRKIWKVESAQLF